jgi:uncharacterized phage protein (TIGR02218 family)
MRTLPSSLSTKLTSGDTTSLCRLFMVTQLDGTITYFTDAQQSVTVSGVTYEPAAGVAVGALQLRANEASGSLTMTVAAVDGGTIGFDDLIRGAYDNAELRFYVADHSDPDDEKIEIWRGWFNNFTTSEVGEAQIEVNGLLHKARYFITEQYSPVCRAQFGDSRCGITLATYTRTGTVVSASGYQVTVTLDSAAPTGGFALGSIVATSGANVGRGVEIRSWNSGTSTATCFVQPSLAFQAGDTVQLIAGCDYTTGASGCGKYSNILNFRGEPFVPGQDAVAAGYAVWTDDGSETPPGALVNGGDLVVVSPTSSTLTLQFSDYGPSSEYSYEYRINGGPAIALAENRIITGLSPETTYSLEVRPVRTLGGRTGSWSNVAQGTTQPAAGASFLWIGAKSSSLPGSPKTILSKIELDVAGLGSYYLGAFSGNTAYTREINGAAFFYDAGGPNGNSYGGPDDPAFLDYCLDLGVLEEEAGVDLTTIDITFKAYFATGAGSTFDFTAYVEAYGVDPYDTQGESDFWWWEYIFDEDPTADIAEAVSAGTLPTATGGTDAALTQIFKVRYNVATNTFTEL